MNARLVTYARQFRLGFVSGQHVFQAQQQEALGYFAAAVKANSYPGQVHYLGKTQTFRLDGAELVRTTIWGGIATIYDEQGNLWEPAAPRKARVPQYFQAALVPYGIVDAAADLVISNKPESDVLILKHGERTKHPRALCCPTPLHVYNAMSRWFPQQKEPQIVKHGHVVFDKTRHLLGDLYVPPKLAEILTCLIENSGMWLSREELATKIWGTANIYTLSNLANCINRLRVLVPIESKRHKGYRV